MTDLIRKEIDTTKLPKRAVNILKNEKVEMYLAWLNKRPTKPPALPLYEKDYAILAEKLKDIGQDITRVTYRGYRLKKYAE